MTINQAIEYATSGQSSAGPITQNALRVLAGAAQDRQRLLDACERFLKADSHHAASTNDYLRGRDHDLRSAAANRRLFFDDIVATVKSMGGLPE